MDSWIGDFRVAFRSLGRAPGFTMVVVAVMALGIGANTMIFNVANAFLFRAFPFHDEQKNVRAFMTDARHDENEMEFSYPDFEDLRRRTKAFEAVAAYYESQAYVNLGQEPERFQATAISSGFMSVYQAPMVIGREFLREEEQKSRSYGVILISHKIWTERFGADPRVLGRTVKMNGRVRTIVGVVAQGFRFPETADFFIPIPNDPAEDTRDRRYVEVVGRLRAGANLSTARAELSSLAADLSRQYPSTNEGLGIRVARTRELITEDMGPMLLLLLASVGFVLLIACANVANLLLARGAGRQREIALRFALGATRARIVRHLMAETLILTAFGGLFGLLLAVWGRDLVLASIPEEMPFWMKFDTDLNTVVFMIGVTLLSALIAGLLPSFQTSQVEVNESLKEGGHHGTASRGRARLRSGLVVAEIALALVLLTGSGLMIRSFLNMSGQRTLVRSEGLLSARLTMPVAVYTDNRAKLAFMDGLMPAIAALPGVRQASATNVVPLGNSSWNTMVSLPGDPTGKDAPRRRVFYGIVRPGYFDVMGIARRSGRDFETRDDSSAARVAIVSQSAAETLWPGKDPLGQQFRFGAEDTSGWRTVVGVVGDVRQNIDNNRPPAAVYVPHMQEPIQSLALVVHHDGEPGALATAMRRAVQARDGDMPLFDVRTMEESLRYGLWEQRIYVSLMTVFAILALVIAGIGIYGVMAYSVAQRTQEIGIRMALGAAREDVLRLVVGQAMRLTALGVGIGLAGAYAVTRLMTSLLFGVSVNDPPTFIGVTVLLAASAVLAAWLPAEQATRVDPMVALRAE